MLLLQGVVLRPWVLASVGVIHPASHLAAALLLVVGIILPTLCQRPITPAVKAAVLVVVRLLPGMAAQADAHAFMSQPPGIVYMAERWKVFAGVGWFHGLLLQVRAASPAHQAGCMLMCLLSCLPLLIPLFVV